MALTRNQKIGGGISAAALATVVAFFALTGPTVVPVGANLQEYINNASAGTVLELAPGGVFDCNCVMKSGVEIDGKSAAKIRTPNSAPAVDVVPGSRDITVRNVEITTINPAQLVYDIVRVGAWQTTDIAQIPVNITFDNVWVHGQPTQDSQRGIAANGINVTITNSRITDIHGRGIESQGVAAWNTPGPIKIINNRIETSTENILFGGADSHLRTADGGGVVPSDIEIRRNYLYKPLTWHERDPSFAGIDWSIKNLLELKVGRNVVIDGNVLENCWADAQIGYAVLFTVRGDDGRSPWNTIENVSFTNNTIKNVAGGFQLLGKDYAGASTQAKGLRIANNVIQLGSGLGFNGRLILVQQYDGLVFENNESNPPQTFMILTGADASGALLLNKGLVYRNNLVSHGQYGLFADSDRPYTDFAPDAIIAGNYIYNAPASGRRITGNTYLAEKPATVPAGVGVDYAALQAAQGSVGPLPSPSATATVTISPSPKVSPTAPPADGPSPDNTRIPTATKIVDDRGAVWTLSGIRMLRNGQDTGGYGSALLWCGGRIYGLGEDHAWWQYMNPGWSRVGADPCASPSPVPTATSTPTQTPTPVVTPTVTPTPQPVPTATVAPSPSPTATPVRVCRSGERPGNPPRCMCRNNAPVRPNGKCP